MRWFAAGLLLATASVGAADAADAAQLVVIESNFAGLAPGQIIDARQTLTLPDGTRVKIVNNDGAITVVSGPWSGAPAATSSPAHGDAGVVTALSRLFASPTTSTSSLGTFRSLNMAISEDGLNPGETWSINVFQSSSQCVPAHGKKMLWRPDPGRDMTLIIEEQKSGKRATVDFPLGEHQVAWPETLPLVDGAEYSLRDADNFWVRKVVLHVAPPSATTDVLRAAWMAERDCKRQAKALLASLP